MSENQRPEITYTFSYMSPFFSPEWCIIDFDTGFSFKNFYFTLKIAPIRSPAVGILFIYFHS